MRYLVPFVLLLASACAPAVSPYTCTVGSPNPSPVCEPDTDRPVDGVYWSGCGAPDTWVFVATAADPEGRCSVDFRRGDVGPGLACDGTQAGPVACVTYGCGWVRGATSDECEAMRADCITGGPFPFRCEYVIGDVP